MNSSKNQVVVNYSSSSYGSVLFRSPNSPPPSPSPSPPHSIANVSNLFLSSSLHKCHPSSSSRSIFPLPQPRAPPLLPLPATGRLPHPRAKRKARNAVEAKKVAMTKGDSPAVGSSMYLMSPPPSSLPLPRFSLTRPKAVWGAKKGTAAVSCVKEVNVGGGGGADELMRVLHI